MLAEGIQLPDGTRGYPLSKVRFYIYDPVDQETTNAIPPYPLSISPGRDWIIGEEGEHICRITPSMPELSQSAYCQVNSVFALGLASLFWIREVSTMLNVSCLGSE